MAGHFGILKLKESHFPILYSTLKLYAEIFEGLDLKMRMTLSPV